MRPRVEERIRTEIGGGVVAKAELLSGESKNIEYKAIVPDKSEKYMKTVVAFANTQGGRLVIGIDDETRQVIGVDNDILFQTMDALTNAISDSCEPQIIPDIEPQTVDGKTVIVITVEVGKNRPYYIKSKGKEKGTYIRGLYNGLTYEEVMKGHSKIRNKLIANIFSQMGLVEAFDDMFRVNLFRKVQDNGSGRSFGVNGGENFGDKTNVSKDRQKVTDTQQKILECIAEDKSISAKKIAEKIGVSGRTVENNIKKMKASEILTRHGSPKSGYWEIVE